MSETRFPRPVLERLCRLYTLCGDWESAGRETFTSHEAARYLGASSATVRKDLSWVGWGFPGTAYRVAELRSRLAQSLGLGATKSLRACLVGLGALGLGLWESFRHRPGGWEWAAGFDSRPNRLEQLDLGIPLYSSLEIPAVVRREGIELAVLAVNAEEAQKASERLALGGIRAIVNFSSAVIRVNKAIEVRHASVDLETTIIQALLRQGRKGENDETRL